MFIGDVLSVIKGCLGSGMGKTCLMIFVLLIKPVTQASGDELTPTRLAFQPAFEPHGYNLEAVAVSTRERAVVDELASVVSGMVAHGKLSALAEFEGHDTTLGSLGAGLIERGEAEGFYLRHLRLYKKDQLVRYDTEEDFFGEANTDLPPRYKCTWIWGRTSDPSESRCYFINHVSNEARISTSGIYRTPPLTWEILTYPTPIEMALRLLVGVDASLAGKPSMPVSIDEGKLADLVSGNLRGVRVESESSSPNVQTTRLFLENSVNPVMEIRLGLVGTNAFPLLILVRDQDDEQIQTGRAIYYVEGFAAPAGGIAFNRRGESSEIHASACKFSKFDDAQDVPDDTFSLGSYEGYVSVLDETARTFYTNGVITTNVVWSDEKLRVPAVSKDFVRAVIIGAFAVISLVLLGAICWRWRTG